MMVERCQYSLGFFSLEPCPERVEGLRTLSPAEHMLIQAGILAIIFLGETLTATKFAVMILVFVGDS